MIEVRNLTKSFHAPSGPVRVLEDLNFEVADGDAVAIVGPSGSGKTTLLNILGAMERSDGGLVRVGGKEISRFNTDEAAAFRNKSLGFVFQQHHLLPQLNVLENVLVPRLAGGWSETAKQTSDFARELLERVGLAHRLDHQPWQLSGGEKLRVAVARALVNRPSIVLADEPTGMLDQQASDKVVELLLGLNRERGMTMVVVTHHDDLARRIGRAYALVDGKLEEAIR